MFLFHVSVRANFVFLFRVYHLHTRVSEENKFHVLRKEKETNCVNICILCVCTCYQRLVHTLLPSWKPCVRMYGRVCTALLLQVMCVVYVATQSACAWRHLHSPATCQPQERTWAWPHLHGPATWSTGVHMYVLTRGSQSVHTAHREQPVYFWR